MRESLFAVLGPLHGTRVLDLYAGSGALGIEAISRGAERAVCVDGRRAATSVIGENVAALGLAGRVYVVARRVGDCAQAISAHAPFDLVLADPPYADVASGALAREVATLFARASSLLADGALVVIEHAARDAAPLLVGLELEERRRWGDTAMAFYRREVSRSSPPGDPVGSPSADR